LYDLVTLIQRLMCKEPEIVVRDMIRSRA